MQHWIKRCILSYTLVFSFTWLIEVIISYQLATILFAKLNHGFWYQNPMIRTISIDTLGPSFLYSFKTTSTICFYCMSKLRTTKLYWNIGADNLLLPHVKLFQKMKEGLELVYLPQLLNIVVQLPLFLEILGNECIVIICFPICNIIKFEINLSFLIKLFP